MASLAQLSALLPQIQNEHNILRQERDNAERDLGAARTHLHGVEQTLEKSRKDHECFLKSHHRPLIQQHEAQKAHIDHLNAAKEQDKKDFDENIQKKDDIIRDQVDALKTKDDIVKQKEDALRTKAIEYANRINAKTEENDRLSIDNAKLCNENAQLQAGLDAARSQNTGWHSWFALAPTPVEAVVTKAESSVELPLSPNSPELAATSPAQHDPERPFLKFAKDKTPKRPSSSDSSDEGEPEQRKRRHVETASPVAQPDGQIHSSPSVGENITAVPRAPSQSNTSFPTKPQYPSSSTRPSLFPQNVWMHEESASRERTHPRHRTSTPSSPNRFFSHSPTSPQREIFNHLPRAASSTPAARKNAGRAVVPVVPVKRQGMSKESRDPRSRITTAQDDEDVVAGSKESTDVGKTTAPNEDMDYAWQ